MTSAGENGVGQMALSSQEQLVVQSLKARLQEVRKQLDEVQSSTARHNADVDVYNQRFGTISDELLHDREQQEKLKRKHQKAVDSQQGLFGRLEDSHQQLQAAAKRQMQLMPRAEYDDLQKEMQSHVDLLMATRSQNTELRQELNQVQEASKEKHLTERRQESQAARHALPLQDAAVYKLQTPVPAARARKLNGFGSSTTSGVHSAASLLTVSSTGSAHGSAAQRSRTSSLGPTDHSRLRSFEARERASEAELTKDKDRLEAQLRRAREHAQDLEQRLQRLSARNRQLEARQRQEREMRVGVREELAEELAEKARQIGVLTNMVGQHAGYLESAPEANDPAKLGDSGVDGAFTIYNPSQTGRGSGVASSESSPSRTQASSESSPILSPEKNIDSNWAGAQRSCIADNAMNGISLGEPAELGLDESARVVPSADSLGPGFANIAPAAPMLDFMVIFAEKDRTSLLLAEKLGALGVRHVDGSCLTVLDVNGIQTLPAEVKKLSPDHFPLRVIYDNQASLLPTHLPVGGVGPSGLPNEGCVNAKMRHFVEAMAQTRKEAEQEATNALQAAVGDAGAPGAFSTACGVAPGVSHTVAGAPSLPALPEEEPLSPGSPA